MYCDECKDQAHSEKANLQAEIKAVEKARDEIRNYAKQIESERHNLNLQLSEAQAHVKKMQNYIAEQGKVREEIRERLSTAADKEAERANVAERLIGDVDKIIGLWNGGNLDAVAAMNKLYDLTFYMKTPTEKRNHVHNPVRADGAPDRTICGTCGDWLS